MLGGGDVTFKRRKVADACQFGLDRVLVDFCEVTWYKRESQRSITFCGGLRKSDTEMSDMIRQMFNNESGKSAIKNDRDGWKGIV